MGCKVDKIKLKPEQDRRVKLTDVMKEDIRGEYKAGGWSLNTLAKKYGVSKKSILLIVNDESNRKAKEYRKNNWDKFKQSKEEHTEAIRNTRKYKKELLEKGELKIE